MASRSSKSIKTFSKVINRTKTIDTSVSVIEKEAITFSESFIDTPDIVVTPILDINTNSYLSHISNEGFTIRFSSKLSGSSKIRYRASGKIEKIDESEEDSIVTKSVDFGSSTVSFYRTANTFSPVPTIVGYTHNYGKGIMYKWEVVDVPDSSVTSFSSDTASSPTFTTDSLGSHTVKLTVTSSDGYSKSDSTTFTVVNRAPTVELGDDVIRASSFLYDVVSIIPAFEDIDDDSLSFSLDFVSKPEDSSAELTSVSGGFEFMPGALGTYVIKGTVDDGMGKSNSVVEDFVNIIINTPPIVTLTSEVSTIAYNGTREIILDGRASLSPIGNPLIYSWEQFSKPTAAGKGDNCTLENYYSSKRQKITSPKISGKYIIALTIHDGVEFARGLINFFVNVPPTASISGDAKIYTKISNFYNGSKSATNDPDQTLTYIWDVVDQSDSSKTQLGRLDTADLTLTNKGSYDVNLTVNDGYDNNLETMMIAAYDKPSIGPIKGTRRRSGTISESFSSLIAGDELIATTLISPSTAIDAGNPLTYLWVLQKYDRVREVYINTATTSSSVSFGHIIEKTDPIEYSKYRLKLTIEDAIETTEVRYSSGWFYNTLPTAVITGVSELHIYKNMSHIISGNTSSIGSGDIEQTLAYTWELQEYSSRIKSFVSAIGQIADITSSTVDLNLPNTNTYRTRLTVSDGYDTDTTAWYDITTYDVPKVGTISESRTRDSITTTSFSSVGVVDDRISLSSTIASEGIIESPGLTYLWDLQRYYTEWGNFVSGSGSTYSFTFNKYDTKYSKYRVRLTISDSNGTTDIKLSNEWEYNIPPIGVIKGPNAIYTSSAYTFDGISSTAVEIGQALTYSWVIERFATTWDSISTGFTGTSTDTLTINTPATGTFRAILTVDDGYDTSSSIHLFDIFKPPEIDSFTEAPKPGSLVKDNMIIISPTILSEGIIADTETLGYFWQLEAYANTKVGGVWEDFNDTTTPALNVSSTGTGVAYTYRILAEPEIYNLYCSKLRVKLTITDSKGTTDEYYSTEWDI